MEVVWQSLGENGTGQTGVKRARQRVAKRPVAEAALAARRLEDARGPGVAGGTEESSPAAGDPGEPTPAAGDPGEPAPAAGDLGEPAPAAGDPERGRNGGAKEGRGGGEKWESQRQPQEIRGGEKRGS